MKYLMSLALISLVGCAVRPPPIEEITLKYRQKVVVNTGFYKGICGIVERCNLTKFEINGIDQKYVVCEIKTTKTHIDNEKKSVFAQKALSPYSNEKVCL